MFPTEDPCTPSAQRIRSSPSRARPATAERLSAAEGVSMENVKVTTASITDIETLVPSWVLDLRAERKSPSTIEAYSYATTQLRAYLVAHGMPTDVEKITREYVSAFLADLLESRSA